MSQKSVFDLVARPVVDRVLEGYNGTIFAYGQTGTGKTYTMVGDLLRGAEENAKRGIIPRSLEYIFSKAQIGSPKSDPGSKTSVSCEISMSFIQIYMEMMQDLLEPGNTNIKIREDPACGVFVTGVSWIPAGSVEQCMNIFDIGEKNRAVAFTALNAHSSRSHTVLMIKVEKSVTTQLPLPHEGETSEFLGPQDHTATTASTLYLVDLAGSERVKKTRATANRLDEAKKINFSLSALGNCIHALTDPHAKHIPYRDSKLTRLLQDSLGGNAKTSMVVTVGPAMRHVDETLSSLKFGRRAMRVQNNPRINKKVDYKGLCIELQGKLYEKGAMLSSAEGKVRTMQGEIDKLSEEVGTLKRKIDAEGATNVLREKSCNLTGENKRPAGTAVQKYEQEMEKVKKYHAEALRKKEAEHKSFLLEVDKNMAEQESLIQKYQLDIQSLSAENAKTKAQLEQIQTESQKMNAEVQKRLEAALRELEEQKRCGERYRVQINDAMNTLQEREVELEANKEEIKKLQDEGVTLRESLAQVQIEVPRAAEAKIGAAKSDFERGLQEKNDTIKSLRTENAELKAGMGRLRIEAETKAAADQTELEHVTSEKEAEVKAAKEETVSIKERLERLQISAPKETEAKVAEMKAEFAQKLQEAESRVRSLDAAITESEVSWKAKLEECEARVRDESRRADTSDAKIKDMEERRKQAEEAAKDQQGKIEGFVLLNMSLKEEVSRLRGEIDSSKSLHEAAVKEAGSERESDRKMMEQERIKVAELESQVNELEKLNSNSTAYQQILSEETEGLRAQIKANEENLSGFQASYSLLQTEHTNLKAKCAQMEKSLAESEAAKAQCTQQVQNAKERIAELQEQIKQLSGFLEAKECELEQQQKRGEEQIAVVQGRQADAIERLESRIKYEKEVYERIVQEMITKSEELSSDLTVLRENQESLELAKTSSDSAQLAETQTQMRTALELHKSSAQTVDQQHRLIKSLKGQASDQAGALAEYCVRYIAERASNDLLAQECTVHVGKIQSLEARTVTAATERLRSIELASWGRFMQAALNKRGRNGTAEMLGELVAKSCSSRLFHGDQLRSQPENKIISPEKEVETAVRETVDQMVFIVEVEAKLEGKMTGQNKASEKPMESPFGNVGSSQKDDAWFSPGRATMKSIIGCAAEHSIAQAENSFTGLPSGGVNVSGIFEKMAEKRDSLAHPQPATIRQTLDEVGELIEISDKFLNFRHTREDKTLIKTIVRPLYNWIICVAVGAIHAYETRYLLSFFPNMLECNLNAWSHIGTSSSAR